MRCKKKVAAAPPTPSLKAPGTLYIGKVPGYTINALVQIRTVYSIHSSFSPLTAPQVGPVDCCRWDAAPAPPYASRPVIPVRAIMIVLWRRTMQVLSLHAPVKDKTGAQSPIPSQCTGHLTAICRSIYHAEITKPALPLIGKDRYLSAGILPIPAYSISVLPFLC